MGFERVFVDVAEEVAVLLFAADDVVVGLVHPEGRARRSKNLVRRPRAGAFDAVQQIGQIVTTQGTTGSLQGTTGIPACRRPKVRQAFLPVAAAKHSRNAPPQKSPLDRPRAPSYDAPIVAEVVCCHNDLARLGAAWDWSLVFNPILSLHLPPLPGGPLGSGSSSAVGCKAG